MKIGDLVMIPAVVSQVWSNGDVTVIYEKAPDRAKIVTLPESLVVEKKDGVFKHEIV